MRRCSKEGVTVSLQVDATGCRKFQGTMTHLLAIRRAQLESGEMT